MTWPVRTRLCVECRAALSDGEPCTWVRHTALRPATPGERARLLAELWPPRGGGSPAPGELGLFDAQLGWLTRGTLLDQLVTGPRPPAGPSPSDPPPRRAPRGAREAPLWTARSRYTGRVRDGAAALPSPVGGQPCVAYGLWLMDRRAGGSPVLLRDGAALAFEIDLDDGRIARVPAGTVDLAGQGVRLKPWSRARMGDYLGLLEAPAVRAEERVVPFREVREAVVRPGDRIALLADLEPAPDGRGESAGPYREAPATVLKPVGRVVIATGADVKSNSWA